MSQLASDNFQYPNGDLHTANPFWVYVNGTWTINSNRIFAGPTFSTNFTSYRSDVIWPSDQYSEVTVVATPGNGNQASGPGVRISASQNTCYTLRYSGQPLLELLKVVNGVVTSLTANVGTVLTGDVVRLVVQGNVLTGFKNGVVIPGINGIIDNSIVSGNAGINGNAFSSNTLTGFSSWNAGDLMTAYSVPDDRNYSVFPNNAVNVQGTKTYTVPAHPSVTPPVDSRKAGAPADSRVASIVPQNSRTPGTFGPGE